MHREHSFKCAILFFYKKKVTNRLFATTVSQLKMCDFSGETFKGFEVL